MTLLKYTMDNGQFHTKNVYWENPSEYKGSIACSFYSIYFTSLLNMFYLVSYCIKRMLVIVFSDSKLLYLEIS